jgi:hypothetical protein
MVSRLYHTTRGVSSMHFWPRGLNTAQSYTPERPHITLKRIRAAQPLIVLAREQRYPSADVLPPSA